MYNQKIQIQKNTRRPAAGLQDLLPAVVAFILIAIVGSLGALILVNFQQSNSVNQFCANALNNANIVNYGPTCTGGLGSGLNVIVTPAAFNAVGNGITGVGTVMSYLPLIALVIVASILIGIVLVAFAFGGRGEDRF